MGASTNRRLQAALSFLLRPLLLAVLVTLTCRVLFPSSSSSPEQSPPARSSAPKALIKALVLASTSTLPSHEKAWISSVPPSWAVHVYNTDVPGAVPLNKGNEAMAYLTYIIDHYHRLPDVVFFHHAHAASWHQSLASLDEVASLRASYVRQAGFVSSRCLPGCENVIPVAAPSAAAAGSEDAPAGRVVGGRDVQLAALLGAFVNRSAGETVPARIAAPCCAQFAVSAERVRRRERGWWVALRQWLVDTPLGDRESGRLLEYTWHLWMGAWDEL